MDDHLKNISDGKLYTVHDMAKIGCNDCAGCSQCCCDMGQSIVVDPYDAYRLCRHLGQSFDHLLKGPLEMHVEDGLILPNLGMKESENRSCHFLNELGRCSIHDVRPGLCRLFPLGRNYTGGKLDYFILKDACPAKQKTKVKISRWLDIQNLRDYQAFLVSWHSFVKALKGRLREIEADEQLTKSVNMMFLHVFYLQEYTVDDFYPQFYIRLERMKQLLV